MHFRFLLRARRLLLVSPSSDYGGLLDGLA
jgi:hypothetical protein